MTTMQIAVAKMAKEPVVIDADRVFYHKHGGFRHDWSAWEVEDGPAGPQVRVLWPGYSVVLTGTDAFNFLSIVKCKHVERFRR
ncbi:hypothetical protein [Thermus phage P23-45]|uniref:Uncharacterized protein n=1 Tax=Thermus virus P23-45 TaxID=2914006 RepID=A7XX54_BP234|nr:hypothetical protein P23p30 [Thermus phage P23-45]ABU96863.1 hypothetical protein P23p30 [Thermus phage P23-45]UYB98444.1 hypothetical protein [Thermus phage P23-45]